MGVLIVKERVPAFIITLGGLLVFKGVHWLVIKSATIPVVPGGEENLYSRLTTYYLPRMLGYCDGAVIVACSGSPPGALENRRAASSKSTPKACSCAGSSRLSCSCCSSWC